MKVSGELQTLQNEVEYNELVRALLEEQDALVKQIVHLRMRKNRLHTRLSYAKDGVLDYEIPIQSRNQILLEILTIFRL